MARFNKRDNRKKAIIKALESNMGIVTNACLTAKVSRGVFYKWIENDPVFSKKVDEVTEYAKDFVESKLYKLIADENVSAIIFYAKTKMRDRGYCEQIKTDITTNGKDINEIDLTKLSTEELIKRAEALNKIVYE